MALAMMAHVGAVDTIEVFRKRASGELKQVMDEALPTVQSHLEHAKSLCQKIEGKAGEHGKSDKHGDGGR